MKNVLVELERNIKDAVVYSMITKLAKVDAHSPQGDIIKECADIIKLGGLVAFPTETVYGLGANAFSPEAVKKIYAAKGRPSDNPLIVHISKKEDIGLVAEDVSEKGHLLIEAFWPGPLTLVLKKTERIPMETSGGLDTIAVRMPQNKIANLLIKEAGVIAAPSANLSGRPSSTQAEHVMTDLNTKINAVIDGGSSVYGLESTIIDMTTSIPCLLRPGSITIDMLENVIGKIIVDKNVLERTPDNEIPKSPGMKYIHYSPLADVTIVMGEEINVINKIIELARSSNIHGDKVGILATDSTKGLYKGHGVVLSVGDRKNPNIIAKNLFKTFRDFDDCEVTQIFAEGFSGEDLELAIMNRLKKAAGYNIINV